MRTLELRRHAQRDKDEDHLSPEGREAAARVGKELSGTYDVVFVSPAKRARETAELFVGHGGFEVVPGLASEKEPGGLAAVLRGMLERIPEGGRALAVGHTPLLETGVLGLTGREIEQLDECEGVVVVEENGGYHVEEQRL